jgi:hypothetical protein
LKTKQTIDAGVGWGGLPRGLLDFNFRLRDEIVNAFLLLHFCKMRNRSPLHTHKKKGEGGISTIVLAKNENKAKREAKNVVSASPIRDCPTGFRPMR